MFIELRKLLVPAAAVFLFVLLNQANADDISVMVAHPLDDIEENLADPDGFDQPSSDLELGTEGGPGGLRQAVGLRFLDIGIPAGSTISSAGIQFMVDEDDDEVTDVRIYGELAPNSDQFAIATANVTGRTRTSNFVLWSIPAWSTEGTSGPDQLTPDLDTIVQEIIGQPGWAAGNAMSFIILPDPIDSDIGERTAISFDKVADNPGMGFVAPTLNVNFQVPEPSSMILVMLGLVAMLGFRGRR